jgi:restriction system protein
MSDNGKEVGGSAPSGEPPQERAGEPGITAPFGPERYAAANMVLPAHEQGRRAYVASLSANDIQRRMAHRAAALFSGTGGVEVFPTPLPLMADAPSLLLQTVIVAGERTNERPNQGTLIQAVALPWFDVIALLQKDPSIAFQISWEKWEEIIAGAYAKAGFEEVILTPRSGDYGRDVIATKKALGTIRVIDQVKAYSPGHLVTGEEVSALWGVMQGDKSSKGFLTTTSDFAPRIKDNPFIMEFIPTRLELINGKMLLTNLEQLARGPKKE